MYHIHLKNTASHMKHRKNQLRQKNQAVNVCRSIEETEIVYKFSKSSQTEIRYRWSNEDQLISL